ncbi:sugar transferase [Arenicella chitinivorans]|uniref:Sugar transferase n=1 Tax=Arenicella chitinivorans TaxID=1329800 RepID=A0A918VLG2_9GAMM|nr:exopolysaccharide biosynthesis polyprenyl glycosylphosphotransferase [Arenicella chitinivorans]GHA06034.1 sugar transferase [Arenicella chitinivorans]
MNSVSTPYYKLLDFSLVLVASIVAYWMRFGDWGLPPEYVAPSLTLAVFCTFGFSATGFYSETNSIVSFRHFYAAAMGIVLAAFATASFLYLTKTGELFSRIWFVTGVALSFSFVTTARACIFRFFSTSISGKVIVIAGGNQTAFAALEKIKKHLHDTSHIQVLEHFSPNEGQETKNYLERIVRWVKEFRQTQQHGDYEIEIWVTADIFNSIDFSLVQLMLSDTAANVAYIPEYPHNENTDVLEVQNVLGIPVINSSLSKRKKINSALKYLEDKLLGIVLVVALSPLLGLIAILIKIDSDGPVFFKQRRHGFGGDEFKIYKFRTMTHESSRGTFSQATRDDARITRMGKLLRRTSLDELPQLINVINGTMSLVGPRPHPIELNNSFQHRIDRFMTRHCVKPGITGLAQIRGFRGETSTLEMMEGRIKYDLEYVQNWSVWLDLKIMIKTVAHVIQTDKAY